MIEAVTASTKAVSGTTYLARVDREKRRLQRTVRPNVPLTTLQSVRVKAAAEEAAMPVGAWIERSALAAIGATGLTGVRAGPEAFVRERSLWLSGVQAMREAQLDVAFLAGGEDREAGERATMTAVLLALCERGLEEASARGRAAPAIVGRRVRAMGITPLDRTGSGVRGAPRNGCRVRVGLTRSEGVLVDAAARISGASAGLYLAATADASAMLLRPEHMRLRRESLEAATRLLEQERDWWAAAASRHMDSGGLPAGWPECKVPPALDRAEAALTDAIAQARVEWEWLT